MSRPPKASKMKVEEILAVMDGDACDLVWHNGRQVRRDHFEAAIVKDWERNEDGEIDTDLLARVRGRRHQQLVKAFRECDLDCGMWSPEALDKLADLALGVLER